MFFSRNPSPIPFSLFLYLPPSQSPLLLSFLVYSSLLLPFIFISPLCSLFSLSCFSLPSLSSFVFISIFFSSSLSSLSHLFHLGPDWLRCS